MKKNKFCSIVLCFTSLLIMTGIALGIILFINGYTYKNFDKYEDIWIKVFIICGFTLPCLGVIANFVLSLILFFSCKQHSYEQTCKGMCWANFILMPLLFILVILAFLYIWANLWMAIMCIVSFYFFFKSIIVTKSIYSTKQPAIAYYKKPLQY